jgi:hypothetical protein
MNALELKNLLTATVSIKEIEERVLRAIEKVSGNPSAFLRFMNNYSKWNGEFAGGVAALTALISLRDNNFQEKGFPPDLADRSTYIAGYIFDAARDEYDDHINPHRDSHRTLAQATLSAMMEFYNADPLIFAKPMPVWLDSSICGVTWGYTGAAATTETTGLFSGLGYHLGSELLADREFSILDTYLRERHSELVDFLKRKTVKIAGVEHRGYAWIGIHSGHGGGAEADHFSYGLQGTVRAFEFLVNADKTNALRR